MNQAAKFGHTRLDLVVGEQRLIQQLLQMQPLALAQAGLGNGRLDQLDHFRGLTRVRRHLHILLPKRQIRILLQQFMEKTIELAGETGAFHLPDGFIREVSIVFLLKLSGYRHGISRALMGNQAKQIINLGALLFIVSKSVGRKRHGRHVGNGCRGFIGFGFGKAFVHRFIQIHRLQRIDQRPLRCF